MQTSISWRWVLPIAHFSPLCILMINPARYIQNEGYPPQNSFLPPTNTTPPITFQPIPHNQRKWSKASSPPAPPPAYPPIFCTAHAWTLTGRGGSRRSATTRRLRPDPIQAQHPRPRVPASILPRGRSGRVCFRLLQMDTCLSRAQVSSPPPILPVLCVRIPPRC